MHKEEVAMLNDSKVFSGYSVADMAMAKQFYQDVLGLTVTEDWMGLKLTFSNGVVVFLYQKDDHVPATFTVLNFPVDDIDSVVDDLTTKGVVFERYPDMPGGQDDKGIMRGKAANQGPDIAWFKDPAGNILSVLSS
ncbi:MAG: putative cell wall protein [Candidatus Saccharibacteria bacterium]|nr:putative cell wall protein [Candidatus Saccharibacteria bacterium]